MCLQTPAGQCSGPSQRDCRQSRSPRSHRFRPRADGTAPGVHNAPPVNRPLGQFRPSYSLSCSNFGFVAGNVWILGGYQSDFARNLTREGSDFAALTTEVVDLTLAESMIDATDIEVVHVANAFGELFARQGPPRGDAGNRARGTVGHPSSRHEAACASGSVAIPRQWPTCGQATTTPLLVVGLSWRRRCPATPGLRTSVRRPGPATRAPTQKFLWPSMFSEIADEYDRRFGIDEAHLHAIAALNFANARRNPNAQTRLGRARPGRPGRRRRDQPAHRGADPPLRLQPDDRRRLGCVLVNDDFLREHPGSARSGGSRGGDTTPSASACARNSTATPATPMSCRTCAATVRDALDRAQVDLDGVDGFEVHDCFTPPSTSPSTTSASPGPGIVEGHRERRDRDRRPVADQPEWRPDRRRPPGRGHRHPDGARRRQTGQRARR